MRSSRTSPRYSLETEGGKFSWRNVPNLGSPEWIALRSEVEDLEKQRRDLEAAMLVSRKGLRDAGERTDDLARLHEIYLDLQQREARLKLDEEELKAQMIQRMQEFEAISGVCRFRRSPRPVLDDASFREAHEAEAAQCYFGLAAHIQWRIYGSRSY